MFVHFPSYLCAVLSSSSFRATGNRRASRWQIFLKLQVIIIKQKFIISMRTSLNMLQTPSNPWTDPLYGVIFCDVDILFSHKRSNFFDVDILQSVSKKLQFVLNNGVLIPKCTSFLGHPVDAQIIILYTLYFQSKIFSPSFSFCSFSC